MSLHKKYDFVFIGSGVSCLSAAVLAAQKGHSVCVLEKANKVGGYIHCFKRFGHRFDTGAHYVGSLKKGQPFRVLLEYLGVFDESDFIELDPQGFDVFHHPDFQFSVPAGYEAFEDRLSTLVPSEKSGIQTLLRELKKSTENFQTYHFQEEVNQDALLKSMETSLAQCVESHVKDSKLKRIFYNYCALHGARPEDTPLGMHAIIMDSLMMGAWGFRHGGEALAKRFVQKIEKLGGQVLLKHEVTRIQIGDSQAKSVTLSTGEEIFCDHLVSATHPRSLVDLLSDTSTLTPAFRTRVKNLKESISFFGVYAKTALPAHSDQTLKNDYFFKSTTSDSPHLIAPKGEAPEVIFRSAAMRDLQAIPDPKTLSFNLIFACENEWFAPWQGTVKGQRGEDYLEFKKLMAQKSFDLVDHYQKGFKEQVLNFDSSSPLTNQHYNPSPYGSAYGLYHGLQNTGARSWGPRTKISNLFLTGQNTLFPGVMGAAISGLRTMGHLFGIKPYIKELKERTFEPSL